MTSNGPPKIRVIVPSYAASKFLNLSIPALMKSKNIGPFDVVVVENGPQYEMARLTESNVHFERCPIFGSAAAARNWGTRDSKADIFVFVDADVLVNEYTIADLIAPLINQSAEATVGNYSNDITQLTFAQAYKQTYVSHTYSRQEGYILGEFWSAVGAIRADVFRKVGGFEESFRGAAGEDTELGQELTAQGFRIMSVPRATGKHLHNFTVLGVIGNDFHKGTLTVRNILRRKSSFANNRHSTSRDMLAVASSVMSLLLLPAALITLSNYIKFVGMFCVLSYLWARLDLLRSFFRHGMIFGIRALLFAYLLDLVRAVAVIKGGFVYLLSSEISPRQLEQSSSTTVSS